MIGPIGKPRPKTKKEAKARLAKTMMEGYSMIGDKKGFESAKKEWIKALKSE